MSDLTKQTITKSAESGQFTVSGNTTQGNTSVEIKSESPLAITLNAWRNFIISIVIVCALVVVLVFCLWVIAKLDSSPENKTQAWATIAAIIGGLLGYITGQAIK